MKAGEPRELIILPGTPTETTAHSRKRTRFIKTVLYFYHRRIILTSWWMTHSSGPLSEAYTGDLREMNHCVAAARAVKPRLGSARRVEEPASQMRKKKKKGVSSLLLLPPGLHLQSLHLSLVILICQNCLPACLEGYYWCVMREHIGNEKHTNGRWKKKNHCWEEEKGLFGRCRWIF